MRNFLLAITLIGGTVAVAPDAAQSYPSKPVRVIMPFAARGGLDIVLRPLLQKMSESLRQNLFLDSRAGANGTLGTVAAEYFLQMTGPREGIEREEKSLAKERRTSIRRAHGAQVRWLG